jgi:hypothetical protein
MKTYAITGTSTLALGAALLLAAMGCPTQAHAAARSIVPAHHIVATRTGLPQAMPWHGAAMTVADSDSDSKTGSPSASRKEKGSRTNAATGAKDRNAGHMSDQKGNQPKSGVKTD